VVGRRRYLGGVHLRGDTIRKKGNRLCRKNRSHPPRCGHDVERQILLIQTLAKDDVHIVLESRQSREARIAAHWFNRRITSTKIDCGQDQSCALKQEREYRRLQRRKAPALREEVGGRLPGHREWQVYYKWTHTAVGQGGSQPPATTPTPVRLQHPAMSCRGRELFVPCVGGRALARRAPTRDLGVDKSQSGGGRGTARRDPQRRSEDQGVYVGKEIRSSG
jgi:hypothetical protein